MRFSRARVSSSVRAEAQSESRTIAAGYFWFYAGVGAFSPFAAVYYRSLGFSGAELGLLAAMSAIGIALTGPVWGVIADTFGIHRQIMRGVLLVAAMMSLLLAHITAFGPFLITLAVIALALVPMPSLWDSYAVSAVERGGAPYGVLRVFGSIGFSAMVLTMGQVMADGLSVAFLYAYAACHLVTFLVTLRLPPLGERQPRKFWDGISHVLRMKGFLLILLVAVFITTGYAMLGLYLTVHVESLGGSTRIAGAAYAVSAMSELPVIGFGAVILRRLGARNVIFVAIFMYFCRFAILGFTGSVIGVLGAQAMHGMSFGMFLIASVTLAHRLVGRDNAATAQALLAMCGGVGNIAGSFIGGIALDHTTTTIMYRGVMALMVVTFVIFVVGSRIVGRSAFEPAMPPQ